MHPHRRFTRKMCDQVCILSSDSGGSDGDEDARRRGPHLALNPELSPYGGSLSATLSF